MVVGSAVEVVAEVVLAREDAIDVAVVEAATAQVVAVGVEVLGNLARSHRLAIEPDERELEDQPDRGRFLLDDEQLPPLLLAFDRDRPCLVPERDGTAVEKAFAGVAPPIAAGEHRRVVGIFLVHDRDHAAHHAAGRILAEVLRQRDQPHLRFGEPVFAGDLGQQTARKAGQRIDEDQLHRAIRRGRLPHHAVELLAGQLGTRDIRLLEDLDQLDVLALRIVADRGRLRSDARVIAAFLIDADPRITVGTQSDLYPRFSHFNRSPITSPPAARCSVTET